jgi:hypothetical protein
LGVLLSSLLVLLTGTLELQPLLKEFKASFTALPVRGVEGKEPVDGTAGGAVEGVESKKK